MKTPLLLILGLVSFASSSADDRRDRDNNRDRRREEPRIIVFEHADFRGDSLVLYPGDTLDNLSGKTFEHGAKLNDGISSIVVEGGAEVYMYENARYKGQALRVTESVRDLTGRLVSGAVGVSWNDRISSLKVERIRGYERPDRPAPGRPDGPDRPGGNGNPEKIINASFQDILGRNPDPGELRDFRSRFLDQGWNERLLRDHLHSEERYRIEAADRIIRRAYLDVLGRAVDESGLRTYRKNMLERNWTDGDVRDDLRKSAEFRSKPRS
jgi:hypothetical protein